MIPKPTRHEIRSCLSKVKYLKDTAKKTARAMRLRFKEKNIKSYRCRYCPYWHVGHAKREQ
jgi:hypothetical protein